MLNWVIKALRGAQAIVPAIILIALIGLSAAPIDANAQIEIGFCQGSGGLSVYTISFLVCCPGDLVLTKLTVSTPPVDCSDAGAVMGAISAAVATMSYGGNPVFGPSFSVPSPIAGQARSAFPLDAAFVAAGCCVVGGSASFDCGTVSLRINAACDKSGGGDDPGPVKPKILGPAPPFPSTLVIQFIGCPPIFVPLAGGESAATVQSALLAALLGAGYTAFINGSGDIEVTIDCNGGAPLGVDEFGLSGGVPMALSLEVCPPESPVRIEERSWGQIKSLYRQDQ